MKQILITGATGHAGSHLVERILWSTDWNVVSLQRLPSIGKDLLAHVLPNPRIRRVYSNFRQPLNARALKEIGRVDYIIHNGARVPCAATVNSDPDQFLQDNTIGTFNMLEAARQLGVERFLYTSTGQVLGPHPLRRRENEQMDPPHMYAASKGAGELLVRSYFKSFQLPTVTTRVMNLFGERQQATKFVPGTLARILRGEVTTIPVDVAGRAQNVQWLHADSYAQWLLFLLTAGTLGETYHLPGTYQTTEELAIDIGIFARRPVRINKKPQPFVEEYHLDVGTYTESKDYPKTLPFSSMLERTLSWYMYNRDWLGL